VSRERECKFGADAGYRLPELPGAVALPTQELEATYYDTPSLQLARAGASLRYRTGEGKSGRWTAKLPDEGNGQGPGLVRREVDVDATGGAIPPELARLVRAHARSSSLGVVGVLKTTRRRVQVQDTGTGDPLVEVADDEVAVLDGVGEVVARFREIEAELMDGAPVEVLAEVAERLQAAGADAADPTSKIARALGARASAPPDVVVPELGKDASMADVVGASIASALARLVAHDPGVRLGGDIEDVHQARVAARRLRSDLRTFRALIEPEANRLLRDELQWLGHELGQVRDADVLLERLREQIASLPAADARAGAALLHRLGEERKEKRAELLAALDSERYLALLDGLVAAAADPPVVEAAGTTEARKALPSIVAPAWKHLHHAVAHLGRHPEDEALHEVRIRAKRARYAAEAASAVMGKPAAKFAKAVAGVQGALGDLQDAVVAEAWLRQASKRGPAAQAMVAGQLVVVQREAAESARRAWPAAWHDVDVKKLRAWLA
jgi:CHAD domain-containing protein